MRNKYFKLLLIALIVVVNGCTEDESIEVIITDISVIANQTNIVWENDNDLNTQINNSFVFNYNNISPNEIETITTINQDTTLVTAFIDFKEEFSNKYTDSNISNNSASISLTGINIEVANDTEDEDADSSVFNDINDSLSDIDLFDLNGAAIIDIPVKFHIINKNNGSGNDVSVAIIENSIQRLNEAFDGTKLNFVQCGEVNEISNSEFFEHQKDNEIFAEDFDVPNVLNIYIPDFIYIGDDTSDRIAGYAFFPYESTDRIYVADHRFNSSTFEHEIGHYFSLYHTFSNKGLDGGDDIVETEPSTKSDEKNNINLPTPCSYDGDASPPLEVNKNNFLSAAPKACRTSFVQEQIKRIAYSARIHRDNLICGNSTGGNSDIDIEEIYLEEDANDEYDINVRFKNIGTEATPNNETINIEYFVDGNSIGTDTHSNMDVNEDRVEYFNDYQFSSNGNHTIQVVIEQVSNETVTSNNTLSIQFDNSSSSGNSITPSDSCSTAPILQVNTEYDVNIDLNDYTYGSPIEGESSGGTNVRGFWIEMDIPSNWSGFHNITITDVSGNFDPVIGLKTLCSSSFYLYQPNTSLRFANLNGYGGGETFEFNANASNNFYIRIYHYYDETPNISFKIKVE